MNKRSISRKLFVITSLSLCLLLGLQLIFQGIFLERFYTAQKKNMLVKEMKQLQKKITKLDSEKINYELLMFSQKLEVASGIVNLYGIPVYGFESGNAFIELETPEKITYKVYLEGVLNKEELRELLFEGQSITVEGIAVKGDANEIYPNLIKVGEKYFGGSNISTSKPTITLNKQIIGETNEMDPLKAIELEEAQIGGDEKTITGKIKLAYIPKQEYGGAYRENQLLTQIGGFLREVLKKQTPLIVGEPILYESTDDFIGITNVIEIIPFVLQEEPVLLVAMMSLEQIDETIGIISQYTIMIFIVVLSISLLVAYIYSKKITNPLVELNQIAKSIAELNFETQCKVRSDDEIGQLAKNINMMSVKLKETLEQLNSDIQLKDKIDRERKEFIADVSHELKTPLTVLKGTCEGILNGLYDPSNKNYIANMLYQINEMSELVQELLEVSRLDKEVEIQNEVFDLSYVFLKIHQGLKSLIKEKNLSITLNVEESMVVGDLKKIETVIKNIYANAIMYTPIGGNVIILTEESEDKVKFSIENYGVQIEEDALERIWEAFYRIDKSRNKALGGSGLGLYIVKQILDKHHAEYGISNTEKGVKVWFELEKPYL